MWISTLSYEEINKIIQVLELVHNNFNKSLIAFESIKNSKLIDKILSDSLLKNDNLLYASLIMPPHIYNILWDDNIENISLKRIHGLSRLFKKSEIQNLLPSIPCPILINENLSLDQITNFSEILEKIIEYPSLVSILEKNFWEDKIVLTHNESFSELIMSANICNALWNEMILNEKMTPEKMHIIDKYLTVELINVLWIFINYENMSLDKITLIGQMMSVEEILEIWVERLTEMSISDLQIELF
jgi:hypothetical protein